MLIAPHEAIAAQRRAQITLTCKIGSPVREQGRVERSSRDVPPAHNAGIPKRAWIDDYTVIVYIYASIAVPSQCTGWDMGHSPRGNSFVREQGHRRHLQRYRLEGCPKDLPLFYLAKCGA